MACIKWEECGLLYTSHELNGQESAEYEGHLASCEECKAELEWYSTRRDRFFTHDVLGEAPSEKIDREILRICSDPRRKINGLKLFPVFIHKALVPAALVALTFVAAGYFSFHMQNARQLARIAALKQKADMVQPVAQTAAAMNRKPPDSGTDSMHKTDANFASHRGNLQENGVVPVNLNK